MTDHDEVLEQAIGELKTPVRLSPDFTARVMASIAADETPDVAPIRRWWQRRWTIEVSPLRALAAAAVLAAVAVGLTRRSTAVRSESVAATPALLAADHGRTMQFLLVAPEAQSVAVVGDFNDWSATATPLVRGSEKGLWWVTVPLAPGRYRYAFVVDGTVWQPDPQTNVVEDEFGRPNSVVTIGGA